MKTSSIILTISGSLWLLAIIVGTFILMKYEYTPGPSVENIAKISSNQWPRNSQIPLSKDTSTLIMFAHPQCPCTRASIAELGQLIAQCPVKPKSYVLFLSPKSMPSGWEKTDLWRSAKLIPGVTVISDIDGIEARKFNAITSGHTLIYNAKGNLIFSSGITGSRGHEGDNHGLYSAKLALQNHAVKNEATIVFGCPLISANNK